MHFRRKCHDRDGDQHRACHWADAGNRTQDAGGPCKALIGCDGLFDPGFKLGNLVIQQLRQFCVHGLEHVGRAQLPVRLDLSQYGRPEIAETVAERARELAFYHSYVGHGTEASIKLAEMVLDRAPSKMSKAYLGLSGSDANKTNIKLFGYMNNIPGPSGEEKDHLALAPSFRLCTGQGAARRFGGYAVCSE